MKLKDWISPFISGVVSSLVLWILKEFNEDTMKHIVSFIITYLPIIVGLLVFFVFLFINDYRRLRKVVINLNSVNEGKRKGEELAKKISEMQAPMIRQALHDAYIQGGKDGQK